MGDSLFNDTSPAPTNPSIRCGVLRNGLRYILQPNAYPANRVHAWLEVNTGSVSETEAEQGLAHWLEHCVFLSTDAFPGVDDLRTKLTSLGMAYTADSNAYTDYTVTCYTLEAPYAVTEQAARSVTPIAPGIESRVSVRNSAVPGLLHILHELVFRARLGRSESARGRRSRLMSAASSEAGEQASLAPLKVGETDASGPAGSSGASSVRAAIEREKLAVLSEAAMRNDVEVRHARRRVTRGRHLSTHPPTPSAAVSRRGRGDRAAARRDAPAAAHAHRQVRAHPPLHPRAAAALLRPLVPAGPLHAVCRGPVRRRGGRAGAPRRGGLWG